MLRADLSTIERAIATALGLRMRRVREILALDGNDWRIRRMPGRDAASIVVEPDAECGMIALRVPVEDGPSRLVETLRVDAADLAGWIARGSPVVA